MSQEQCPVCQAVVLSGCQFCTACGAPIAKAAQGGGEGAKTIISTHRGMPIPNVSSGVDSISSSTLDETLVNFPSVDDPQLDQATLAQSRSLTQPFGALGASSSGRSDLAPSVMRVDAEVDTASAAPNQGRDAAGVRNHQRASAPLEGSSGRSDMPDVELGKQSNVLNHPSDVGSLDAAPKPSTRDIAEHGALREASEAYEDVGASNDKDTAYQSQPSVSQAIRPMRLFVIGCVLIAAGLVWFVSDKATVDTEPLIFGTPEFSYTGDLIRVRLPATSQHPVMVSYPGGRRAVAESTVLPFALSRGEMELGDVPLAFEARVGPTAFPVEAALSSLYKLEVVDASSRSIEMQVTHDAAHSIQVSPGRLQPLTANTHLWAITIPPEMESQAVPVNIQVDVPGRTPVMFQDEIQRPNLNTPFTLVQPSSRWIEPDHAVEFVGFTLPGAKAEANGQTIVADEFGRFSVLIPSDSMTSHAVILKVQSEGRDAVTRSIALTELSKAEKAQRIGVQRDALNNVREEYAQVSTYVGLSDLKQDEPILVEGHILVRQRRGPRATQLIVSMCEDSTDCLLWIDYDGLDVLPHDGIFAVAGVFAGMHTYRSEDGRRRTVPRMDARLVVPL